MKTTSKTNTTQQAVSFTSINQSKRKEEKLATLQLPIGYIFFLYFIPILTHWKKYFRIEISSQPILLITTRPNSLDLCFYLH